MVCRQRSELHHGEAVFFVGFASAFALDLRRPMPQPPQVAGRRGTTFHAWVEEHYARAGLVDILELPGSADESLESASEDDME